MRSASLLTLPGAFDSYFQESDSIMHIVLRELDDIVIIDIKGEVCRSATSTETLHSIVKSQIEQGRGKILLNLEQVGFVDSFGIGELLASYISIQNAGGRMKLIGIPRRVDILFRVVGLDRVFEAFHTESSALQSFIDS
jgi:anti-sigma B factor antagonist